MTLRLRYFLTLILIYLGGSEMPYLRRFRRASLYKMPVFSIQNACLLYTKCLFAIYKLPVDNFFAAPGRGKKQSFLRKFCLYWAAYHGSISVKWPRRLLACSRSGGFNPYNNRKCRIYSVFEVLLYTKCLWISLLISLWITFLLS